MMHVWKFGTGFVAGAVALGAMAAGARADDGAASPEAQADVALHLLEGARYGEAIPAAQALVGLAPSDALSYQVRGAVGLYVGDLRAAKKDFAQAAALNPDNPATLYGQAMGALWAGDRAQAQADLTAARQSASLTAAQAGDADTALAYVRFLGGDLTGARALIGPEVPTDGVRQELAGIMAARGNPADGAARLTAFLATPGGTPRVREDDGLRPLFEAGGAGVEPSVTEPFLQSLYRASLEDALARADARAKSAPHVSGVVGLRGPDGVSSAAVTFYIDGEMAGMVNTGTFAWHTETAGNGWHAVRTDARDGMGNVITSVTRQVYVENADPPAPRPGLAGDAALEGRVWNLLRLRPARKVAEWTLAGLCDAQGDRASGQSHRVVAAALDADYKDARRVARAVFGGQPGHLAVSAKSSPQGLYIGNASRKEVALTFDDGPNPQKTPALLDALAKASAPATFFVVGSRAEAAPDLVRRMAAMGDDVENHSYTHPNMAQTAPAIAETEILRASVVIRALTGRSPRFFRPPGGQRNPVVYRLSALYGQTVALWTVDALNYEELGSPQGLTDFVMKHVQPGAIILMHNGLDGTTLAVPQLAAALRARGYRLVTLTQMVGPHPTVATAELPRP